MNPDSSASRWSAVVAAGDPPLQDRLAAMLRVVGARPTTIVPPGELAVFRKARDVTCVCARVFASFRPPSPVVVLVPGPVTLGTDHHPPPDRPVWLSTAGLDPVHLLGSIVRATLSAETDTLAGVFPGVSPMLVRAFLCAPQNVHTISRMSRALGVSPRRVRAAVQAAGSLRMEHLVARLSCQAWEYLTSRGATRWVAEAYLGIDDRSNFRRACNRAGTLVPWRSAAGTDP